MKDVFLLTPPFTQLNTPYPATAYLKGFFNTKGISSYQMDLGIEVILALFNKKSLENIFDFALEQDSLDIIVESNGLQDVSSWNTLLRGKALARDPWAYCVSAFDGIPRVTTWTWPADARRA